MKLIAKIVSTCKIYGKNIILKRYFGRIELRKPQINSLIFQLNTISIWKVMKKKKKKIIKTPILIYFDILYVVIYCFILLTTCTLLCKLLACAVFSGCFLSAFLAAFFALFSRKRFCNTTVSMLCCSHAPLNDWSNLGLHTVWCWR